jgi:lysophospholipase L1-like esterase
MQPTSGTSALSLRGLSNATITGAARGHSALLFDGVDDWVGGAIPNSTGQRTIVVPVAGHTFCKTSESATPWCFNSGTKLFRRCGMLSSDGSATRQLFECDGVHTTQYASIGASATSSHTITSVLRELNLGYNVADSFIGYGLMRGLDPTQQSKIGMSSTTYDFFCGGAWLHSDDLTTSSFARCALPGWLLFDEALSDGNMLAIISLLQTTIWPAWDFVVEGDSIIYKAFDYLTNYDPLWGGNLLITNLSKAGKHAYTAVANLGTTSGFDAATNLAAALPKMAIISIGANDVSNYTPAQKPAATIYADLVALASYAKSSGAVVGMSTIIPNGGLTEAKEGNRVALNALIASGAGVDYDFLIDSDTWIYTATETRPLWDDSNIYQDTVHLKNGAAGTGCDLWAAYIAERIAAANFLP